MPHFSFSIENRDFLFVIYVLVNCAIILLKPVVKGAQEDGRLGLLKIIMVVITKSFYSLRGPSAIVR